MKNSHIFWGIFFIAIGGLVLLNNFGNLYFDWGTLVKLWPVVLILWGLSLFLKDNKFVKGFIVSLIAILIALTIFSSFKFLFDVASDDIQWNSNALVLDDDADTTNYIEAFNPDIKTSRLHFESGAGYFIIDGASEDLFSALTTGAKNNYYIDLDTSYSNANIHFSMHEKHFSFFHGKFTNNVEMKLNSKPIWDLDFGFGAAKASLDLSSYKVENVKVGMGAAKLRVKLGDKNDDISLHVEAGVSSIDILVPESSGCEIKSKTALTNKHFEGFNKISSGFYRTDNFDNAANKIYLSFDTGVSSIRVTRYSSWQ